MPTSSEALLRAAGEAAADGDYIVALRNAGEVARVHSDHDPARVKVVTILCSMAAAQGRILKEWALNETAQTVAREVARFMLQRKRWLLAIVAGRAALELDPEDADAMAIMGSVHDEMADLSVDYGSVAPAQLVPKEVADDGNSLLDVKAPRDVFDAAVAIALSPDFGPDPTEPPTAIPILSSLAREPFLDLMGRISLQHLPSEHTVIRQGTRDASVFIIVNGKVDVHQAVDGKPMLLGSLSDGAMFGEMALILSEPRSATVVSTEPVDLVEITAESIAGVADTFPEINSELERLAGERLLLSTFGPTALFQSLNRDERTDLVHSMTFHIVPEGEVMVEQGAEPTGLYLIVMGEVRVTRIEGDEQIELATLNGGEIVGEMALVTDEERTSARAIAMDETVTFHLDHLTFDRMAKKHPKLREYLVRLTEIRNREIKASVAGVDPADAPTDSIMI